STCALHLILQPPISTLFPYTTLFRSSDEELLERRISTLGLRLEDTALQSLIQQLHDELSAKGLVFHPPCHIGDEWFVPIGIPVRSEEHTSELQSRVDLVCRLLLEKKN